jgi:hypothetical protein
MRGAEWEVARLERVRPAASPRAAQPGARWRAEGSPASPREPPGIVPARPPSCPARRGNRRDPAPAASRDRRSASRLARRNSTRRAGTSRRIPASIAAGSPRSGSRRIRRRVAPADRRGRRSRRIPTEVPARPREPHRRAAVSPGRLRIRRTPGWRSGPSGSGTSARSARPRLRRPPAAHPRSASRAGSGASCGKHRQLSVLKCCDRVRKQRARERETRRLRYPRRAPLRPSPENPRSP